MELVIFVEHPIEFLFVYFLPLDHGQPTRHFFSIIPLGQAVILPIVPRLPVVEHPLHGVDPFSYFLQFLRGKCHAGDIFDHF